MKEACGSDGLAVGIHKPRRESSCEQPPNPSIEGDVQGLSPSAAPHVKR
jgi:hypothetical protein